MADHLKQASDEIVEYLKEWKSLLDCTQQQSLPHSVEEAVFMRRVSVAVKNEVCKKPRRKGMSWRDKVREKEGGTLRAARETEISSQGD